MNRTRVMRRAFVAALLAGTLAGCRTTPFPEHDPVVGGCETPEYRWSDAWAPAWSPDGREVAFFSAHGPSGEFAPGIYIKDLRSRAVRMVTRERTLTPTMMLQWSPSGRYLLSSQLNWLTLVDVDAGTTISPESVRDMQGGAWDWGVDSIFFTRGIRHFDDPADSMGLFVASAATWEMRRFVPSDGSLIYPAGPVDVRPGGEWIALSQPLRDESGGFVQASEIFIVRRDGSGLRQLTHLSAFSSSPKWIEGGKLIAFDCYPVECALADRSLGHTWVVSPDWGEPRPYRVDISDRNVQFAWPPAVDRTGWRVAATVKNPQNNIGEIYTMSLRHPDRWQPLFVPPIDTLTVAGTGGRAEVLSPSMIRGPQ